MSTSVLADRVDKGVEFLDVIKPQWRAEINRNRLNLAEMDRCVLAQLYGGYDNAITLFNWPRGFYGPPVEHGFALTDEEYIKDMYTYEALTEEWLRRLDQPTDTNTEAGTMSDCADLTALWREEVKAGTRVTRRRPRREWGTEMRAERRRQELMDVELRTITDETRPSARFTFPGTRVTAQTQELADA